MTLFRRLIIATAVVLAVISASGILLVHSSRSSQIDQIDRQLEAASFRPARALAATPPAPSSGHRPPPLSQLSNFYIATLVGGKRETLVKAERAEARIPQVPRRTSTSRHLIIETVGSVSGAGTWRATLVDGVSGEKILVAISLDEVDHSTGQLWVAVGAADAATLFVLLIALWWVYRLGLRPIAEVTAAADAITAGDRSRRAQTPRRAGEAAHLAKAFNVMLDERDATEQLLRQFLADASHELRTPITAISGVSQMWRTGALEGASLDDAMRRLGREAIRVRRLVEDLLLLARLDEGAALCPGPFDLRSVVEATTTDVAEVFPGRRFTTTLQSVSMRGDEERIRQVVSNLVTNAFVHTPPSSTLEVTLESSREQVVLRVIDDGPGLNEECADRVFDRFWRADAARTRSGSGLGLAIVKGIVEAHNGSVIFESSPRTGTVVTVVFPVTPA